jgi:hypothetical protein
VAPEVVTNEGPAVTAAAREVVAPLMTATPPLDAREIVVPEIVTAGAPGVIV